LNVKIGDANVADQSCINKLFHLSPAFMHGRTFKNKLLIVIKESDLLIIFDGDVLGGHRD
jgi:hypothetical protein